MAFVLNGLGRGVFTIKAVVKSDHGSGMDIREIPMPQIEEDEVLVKVLAASICGSDLHMFEGAAGYDWVNVPLVPGHEFAGVVVEVGNAKDSTLLNQNVVVNPYVACGKCAACRRGQPNLCDGLYSPMDKVPARSLVYGFRKNGGMAEYVAVKRDNLLVLPEGCPIEVAGMLEAIGISVHAIERADIKPGDSAVIIGPGPIGLALVAVLANFGLKKLIVTGLKADDQRLKLAKELGASEVIYSDVTNDVEEVRRISAGAGVDFVFESSGFAGAINSAIRMLRKGGELLLVGISSKESVLPTSEIVRGELTIKGVYGVTPKTLERTLTMATSGYQFSKLISHILPLEEALKGFAYGIKREGAKVILKM